MYELLMRVPERDIGAILCFMMLIGCVTTVLLASIIGRQWSRHQQRQIATPLVQELLSRGVPVEEIEDILAAAGCAKRKGFIDYVRRWLGFHHAKPQTDGL